MAKHQQVRSLIASRVRQGDYSSRPFPSTVRLAAELNVDWRTAHKAMSALVCEGILERSSTGRITLASRSETKERRVSVLAPAYPSPVVSGVVQDLERLAAERGWLARLVGYSHDRDPVIFETIDASDGLFVFPLHDELAPEVLAKVQATESKAVVIGEDHTSHRLPSICFENPAKVTRLLEHLYELGHRTIACINTQPAGRVMTYYMDHWRRWMRDHDLAGPLIDQPVEPFQDAMLRAREVTSAAIAASKLDVDAVFCTTGYAALGVIRALADHGRAAGRDTAVCAASPYGHVSQCLTPSLTAPADEDLSPFWGACLDWFASDEKNWIGPLLMHAGHHELFIGESTAAQLPVHGSNPLHPST